MANRKLSASSVLAIIDAGDQFMILDVSDTTDGPGGTNKQASRQVVLDRFAPQGFFRNYQIVPSIASNNLTVALKTLSAADPSTTNPVDGRIGNTEVSITAALSVTVNAGAASGSGTFNAGSAELKTQTVQLFVYLGQRASDSSVFILISRIPYARTYADFSTTAANEKYGAYSGSAPASTDKVENIGRIDVANSGSASYNWSLPSGYVVINRSIFETLPLTWAPIHSRTGTNYTNLPSVLVAIYQIINRKIKITERHTQNATPGGTNNQSMTLPFSNSLTIGTQVPASNNNAATLFLFLVAGSGNTGIFYKYDGTAEATASNIYIADGEYWIG